MTSLDDDFTELVDADIPRVDLVDKAANGTRFLIAKQAGGAGLLDASFVRELLAKSEPDHDSKETVTMTGSPGAIAKMIHEAGRKAVATTPVAKELELDDSPDGMDTDVLLAAPDIEAPGSATDPGSPAWEAVDAATARKWTSILARAKVAIDLLADREMLEAAAGDEDDMGNAWDLQDACCAIDYAISVLAPFAVDEQSEADCGELMEAVGKALAGFDTASLDTIESLGQVRKAGRVLSAGNEAAIRGAVESLQKVLASLPAAPAIEDSGPTVAKTANEEPNMPTLTLSEDVTAAAGQEPAMGVQQADPKPVAGLPVTEMAKADGEKPQMVAVYDKKGNLVGIVDPEKITTIAGAEADDEDDTSSDTDGADNGAPAAPETTDLTPEPPAEAGTPADAVPMDDEAVTKTADNDTTLSDMFKSSLLAAVESAFTEHSANQNTVLAKQADAVLELAGLVETLKGRIGALEEQPAEPRVFTNGAVPPRDLRGMDRGTAAHVDVAKAREQKDRLYKAADATEQNRIAQDMQASAIDALQAIHQQRR